MVIYHKTRSHLTTAYIEELVCHFV